MHFLAQRVLAHIRRQELLRAGDRLGIAVSGGIDSVALLRLLLELRTELGVVVSVVHFNHKLRAAESDADQEFVANLSRAHGLEFYADGDDVARRAAEERISLETAARELRYGFFRHLLGEGGGARNPAGAEAPANKGADNRSAESAAPPKSELFLGNILSKIVTGHTLDDQAETVLMRIIRGSGLRGLGGIYPRILVEDDEGEVCGEILRPLLTTRRRDLEQYLNDIGQPWREDSSNGDERFTRNRLRHLVVPLLEREFNPAVAENLAELAEIARGEEDYWDNEVSGWLGTTVHWSEPDWARAAPESKSLVQIALAGTASGEPTARRLTVRQAPSKIPTLRQAQGRLSRAKDAREMGQPAQVSDWETDLQSRIDNAAWLVANASVSRMWFLGEPVAVQRRLVKAIGERAGIPLEFKHVQEILRFAEEDGPSGKALALPLGWTLRREPEDLQFVTPDLRKPAATPKDEPDHKDYEYELSLSGETSVVETGSTFELRRIPAGADAGYNPDQLLDAESVPGRFRVRNWRPGDRFWPAHTKSPKKIKELLQERQILLPERKLWPVVLSGDEIVWLRGFPVPAKYRLKQGREAILVVETQAGVEPYA